MRNRSKSELPLIFLPFELPGNFPCELQRTHLQLDDPIKHLHVHACLELGYCYEGAGVFMIGQKILPFRGGDVSVINNREPHLARSAEGTTSKWSWILLDTQKLIGPAFPELELLDPSVLCGDRFRNIISDGDDPEIAPLVKMLIRELELKKDGYRMTVRGIVISIMSKLHRLVKKANVEETLQDSTDSMERVGPALKAIIGGYHRKQSVSNLASKCGMSVANFRRIFLEATGLPPSEYLLKVRTQMAATLLESSSKQVSQIALEVGYPSISSLNRNFMSAFRMSPRDWRKTRRTPAIRKKISRNRYPLSCIK